MYDTLARTRTSDLWSDIPTEYKFPDMNDSVKHYQADELFFLGQWCTDSKNNYKYVSLPRCPEKRLVRCTEQLPNLIKKDNFTLLMSLNQIYFQEVFSWN